MRWRYWTLLLSGVLLLLLALAFWPRSTSFNDLAHARASLEKAGYHCVGDRADNRTVNGFTVTKSPIPFEELNHVRRIGPMGPEWKGRIWITRQSSRVPMLTTPNDDAPRVWGRVLAFGDPEFLNEIEGRL